MGHAMQHDMVISSFVAPGEFASIVDSNEDAVVAIISAKKSAHSNVRQRINRELDKYLYLFAEIITLLDGSKHESQSSKVGYSARKDDTRSDARSTQDSRNGFSRRLPPVIEDESDHRMTVDDFRKKTNTQASDQMLSRDRSSVERRTLSSIQKRRESSDTGNIRLTDKELKSFMKEKDELMNLYPQMRGIDSSKLC